MQSFRPAGCEGKTKTMTKHINYATCADDYYDDDEDDNEFVLDFDDDNNNKKKTSGGFFKFGNQANNINNNNNNDQKINDKNKISDWHNDNILPQVASTPLLANKIESDIMIDFKQAIINNNIDKAKNMLDKIEINVNLIFNNGWSPLMYAVVSGCCELVEYFISKGAQVNYIAGIKISTISKIKYFFP
jgi:hypothetical protein